MSTTVKEAIEKAESASVKITGKKGRSKVSVDKPTRQETAAAIRATAEATITHEKQAAESALAALVEPIKAAYSAVVRQHALAHLSEIELGKKLVAFDLLCKQLRKAFKSTVETMTGIPYSSARRYMVAYETASKKTSPQTLAYFMAYGINPMADNIVHLTADLVKRGKVKATGIMETDPDKARDYVMEVATEAFLQKRGPRSGNLDETLGSVLKSLATVYIRLEKANDDLLQANPKATAMPLIEDWLVTIVNPKVIKIYSELVQQAEERSKAKATSVAA